MKHIPYLMLLVAGSTSAQFAVVPTDSGERFAWGENIGWVNFAPMTLTMLDLPYFDTHIASGFAWAENAGWINLGNGSPADGFQYANTDASDFVSISNPTARSPVSHGQRMSGGFSLAHSTI